MFNSLNSSDAIKNQNSETERNIDSILLNSTNETVGLYVGKTKPKNKPKDEVQELKEKVQLKNNKIKKYEEEIDNLIREFEKSIKNNTNAIVTELKAYINANKNNFSMTRDELIYNIKNTVPNFSNLDNYAESILDSIDLKITDIQGLICSVKEIEYKILEKDTTYTSVLGKENNSNSFNVSQYLKNLGLSIQNKTKKIQTNLTTASVIKENQQAYKKEIFSIIKNMKSSDTSVTGTNDELSFIA